MTLYLIKSKLSGLYLDVECAGGSGSKVLPWDKNGGDNQKFYDDPSTGTIRSFCNNCCLTTENDHLYVKDYQAGNNNQKWTRQGEYIKNPTNNKVLDVYVNEMAASIAAHYTSSNPHSSQACGMATNSGVPGENSAKGAQVGPYDQKGGSNQLWVFETVPGSAPATASPYYQGVKKEFCIESQMNWKVLDICQAKMEPGAQIFMYDKHASNEKNQLFYLDGQGFIRSSLNDLAIWSPGKGQGIVTAKPSDDPRTQFYFQGNKIGNKAGEYLDIKGENNQEGAEVITWDLNDGDNQHWNQKFI